MDLAVVLLLVVCVTASVQASPFAQGPEDFIYFPGQNGSVIFECQVLEEFSLSWSINGTEYSLGNLSRGDLPGHTVNDTSIIVTVPHNGTSYTCIASSGSNRTYSGTAYLYIAGAPGPVANLQYSTVMVGEANVSLSLTWEEPFNNFNPIDYYTISGCTRTKSVTGIAQCPNVTVFPSVNGSITNFHLGGLPSNVRYTFMVTATNSLDDGAVISISVSTSTMNTSSPSVNPKGMHPGPANLSMPITFTCHATGEPLPNITWHFNNTELVFPHTKYEMNLTVVNSTTISSSLTVHSVSSSDFGLYMCLASNDAGNSNVSGVLTTNACPGPSLSHGITWPTTAVNGMARTRCARIHPSFGYGPIVTRRCLDGGVWETPDLSRCSVTVNSNSLIIYSTYLRARSSRDVRRQSTTITNNMLGLLDSMETTGIVIRVFSGDNREVPVVLVFQLSAGVSVSDAVEDIMSGERDFAGFEEVSDTIPQLVTITPVDVCNCASQNVQHISAEGNYTAISESVCKGTPLSPCVCDKNVGCMCNRPAYAGNDTICARDTDQDTFPDVHLDCPQFECIKDECPDIYNRLPGGAQDIEICSPSLNLTGVCQTERDAMFGIVWPNTELGIVARAICQNGIGIATRLCRQSGAWGLPNATACQTHQFIAVSEEVTELQDDLNNGDSMETLPERVNLLVTDLMTIAVTDNGSSIFPLDLASANTAMNIAIDVADQVITTFSEDDFIEHVMSMYNIMLDTDNLVGWNQLHQVSNGQGQGLLVGIERFGTLVGDYLRQQDSSVIEVIDENIAMFVTVVNTTTDQRDVSLSLNTTNSSSIRIPFSALHRRATNSDDSHVSVSSFTYRNMERILSFSDNNITVLRNRRHTRTLLPASGVLSATVGDAGFNSSLVDPVELNFTFPPKKRITKVRCGFWNTSLNQGNGGWDTSGVSVVNVSRDTIKCASLHLTSFAVLVDVAGSQQDISDGERKAFTIVTYIGCGASILALLVAITLFICCRKTFLPGIQNFIHLNLSVALATALGIFVGGVETATNSNVGCLVVAILLHYFFTAVFMWMLCEGILIYFLLAKVFNNGIGKKKMFYSAVGWGVPIPIVSITAGVVHDQYTTKQYCWVSTDDGAIWAFTGPIIAVLLVNGVFLLVALRALYHINITNKKSQSIRNPNVALVKSLLKATIILFPLLGFTWFIGMLAVNQQSTVFAWIFTVLSSLQGLFILFFHVIRSEHIWKRLTDLVLIHKPTSVLSFSASNTGGRKVSSASKQQMVIDHTTSNDHRDSIATITQSCNSNDSL